MTTDKLREALRAVPFVPFMIYLTDGRELVVQHPEGAMLLGSGRTLHYAVPGCPRDEYEVVDLLHVTSLTRAERQEV